MFNIFSIVPVVYLLYFIWNLYLHIKSKKSEQNKVIPQLWLSGVILLIVLFFQILNIYNFVTDNFSYNVVYNYSEKSVLWVYKIAASFSNKSGALLLWLTFMAIFSFIITQLLAHKLKEQGFVPLFQAISAIVPLFVSIMLAFSGSFEKISAEIVASEGMGLNPVLYNNYNLLHAPFIFAAFACYYFMYNLAICILINKIHLKNNINVVCFKLLEKLNKYAMILLFFGIYVGALWAYNSLGWGGFWGWDPIENIALVPLVLSLAMFYTFKLVRSQVAKQALKTIICISIVVFPIILLGTFLARGGAAKSIHSYANSNNTELILIFAFLILILILSLILFFIKQKYTINILAQELQNLSDVFCKNKSKIALKDCASTSNKACIISQKTLQILAWIKIACLLGIAFVVLTGTCLPLIANLLKLAPLLISADFYIAWTIPLISIFIVTVSITAFIDCDNYRLSNKILFALVSAVIIGFLAYRNDVNQLNYILLIIVCTFSIVAHLYAIIVKIVNKVRKNENNIKYCSDNFANIVMAIFLVFAVLNSTFSTKETLVLQLNKHYQTTLGYYCVLSDIKTEKYSNTKNLTKVYISLFNNNDTTKKLEFTPFVITSATSKHKKTLFPFYISIGIDDIYIELLDYYIDSDNNKFAIINLHFKRFLPLPL